MLNGLEPGGVWVYAEQGTDGIRPVVCELLGQAVRLAGELEQTVTAVLVGGTEEQAASLATCWRRFRTKRCRMNGRIRRSWKDWRKSISRRSCCLARPLSGVPWRRGSLPGSGRA